LAKKLLSQGGVYVDKKRVKVAGRVMRTGAKVELHLLHALGAETSKIGETPPLIKIVAEGPGWLVVDKPSGIFSAPTQQSDRGDLLDLLSRQLLTSGRKVSLLPVHRLDRPTSGLIIIATEKSAAAFLGAQLESKTLQRIYLAIVAGRLEGPTSVTLPIEGRPAETVFTPLEANSALTLVRAELKTGRTHQVRIHAESKGIPVAGDSKYGRQVLRGLLPRPPRLALHAHRLEFVAPGESEVRSLESPFPDELRAWFDAYDNANCGNRPSDC
jgi:RluA family pseudouridine synthase